MMRATVIDIILGHDHRRTADELVETFGHEMPEGNPKAIVVGIISDFHRLAARAGVTEVDPFTATGKE